MRNTLTSWNERLKGFRTFLALILPILIGYAENVISTAPSISLDNLKTTAILLSPALAKTLWTEVRPRVIKMIMDWLAEGDTK